MSNSVCVVSSNAISRAGLASIVSAAGLQVAATVDSVHNMPWDDVEDVTVALLDSLDLSEQCSAVATIDRSSSSMKPVVLSESFDFDVMARCFSTGAHGYIVKNMPCSSLIASLELVAMGQKVLPSDLAEFLPLEDTGARETSGNEQLLVDASLSQRELDVLRCLMNGHSNKIIARSLLVSDATVKVHVKAILRKLRVDNRTQAAIWGTARGLATHSPNFNYEPAPLNNVLTSYS